MTAVAPEGGVMDSLFRDAIGKTIGWMILENSDTTWNVAWVGPFSPDCDVHSFPSRAAAVEFRDRGNREFLYKDVMAATHEVRVGGLLLQPGTYWLHKKTGGKYVLLHLGVREDDLTPVAVYRRSGEYRGREAVWVRPLKEFCDGRFEAASPGPD